MWDPATFHQAAVPLGVGAIESPSAAARHAPAVLSANGDILAVTGGRGTVRLWDVATRQQSGAAMSAGGPASAPGTLAFSPDGKFLATVRADGTARLWRVATQQPIGAIMTAASTITGTRVSTGDGPAAVAFSDDGTTLATAGGDGSARLWDVAFPAGLLGATCTIADQSLTRQQWADYAGSQPFQQVCPAS